MNEKNQSGMYQTDPAFYAEGGCKQRPGGEAGQRGSGQIQDAAGPEPDPVQDTFRDSGAGRVRID